MNATTLQHNDLEMIIEILEDMIGNTYMYGRSEHNIKGYRIDEEKERVYISTDKKQFDRPFESTLEFLTLLEKVERVPSRQPVTPPSIHYPDRQVDGSVISKLKDVLLDNIEKVKADKNYIPQAEAVKAQVDGIIELSKTEIAYIDALTRLNKHA